MKKWLGLLTSGLLLFSVSVYAEGYRRGSGFNNGVLEMSDYPILFDEAEDDPGIPASDSLQLYAKDKSGVTTLYTQDSTGTVKEIGASEETDPVFSSSEAASITSTDTTNWDTAYGWGDHDGLYLPINGKAASVNGLAITTGASISGNNTGDQDLSSYIKKDGSVDFTGEPTFKGTFTAGENLVAGNICYLKSDGKFWKAKGDAEATTKGRLLIALASISANATGLFLIRGYYTDSGLTAGGTYFISTSTAGAKATTAPSSGNFARVVGWAMSTTSFYFDPSKDYIEVS